MTSTIFRLPCIINPEGFWRSVLSLGNLWQPDRLKGTNLSDKERSLTLEGVGRFHQRQLGQPQTRFYTVYGYVTLCWRKFLVKLVTKLYQKTTGTLKCLLWPCKWGIRGTNHTWGSGIRKPTDTGLIVPVSVMLVRRTTLSWRESWWRFVNINVGIRRQGQRRDDIKEMLPEL